MIIECKFVYADNTYKVLMYVCMYISRAHNKRREEEYPTLTIPCTNALCKVPSVNHQVLSFYINTLRETKGALIGVNSVVLGIVTQGRYRY